MVNGLKNLKFTKNILCVSSLKLMTLNDSK